MMPNVARTQQFRFLVVVCALLGLAVSCYRFRRATIRAFFIDGPAGLAPGLSKAPANAPGFSAAARVRVVLLDGLGMTAAAKLSTLNQACARGADVVVDNGFPTVSLPVQHALWTGLTQAQSGVMYRIAPFDIPPRLSLPVQMPQSVAVAESHNEIVNSFGFRTVYAPVGVKAMTTAELLWRGSGFDAAARVAVGSLAPFVFVHILRIDEAGHAQGASSTAYAQAAQSADALLAALLVAAPNQQTTRWFVLSDHGHRDRGGHADAEAGIRFVRACIFGAGVTPERGQTPMHLVDLHRAIADSLGIVPSATSVGRPWSFARNHPDVDATLPTPALLPTLLAFFCASAGLALTWLFARKAWSSWPWWVLVAYASLTLVRGTITLSNPVVYPPWGLGVVTAIAPGLAVLAAQALWAVRRGTALRVRVVASLLTVPLFGLVAAALLCGAAQHWAGVSFVPPLMPLWSARTLALATAVASSSFLLSLIVLLHGLLTLVARSRTVAGQSSAGRTVDVNSR